MNKQAMLRMTRTTAGALALLIALGGLAFAIQTPAVELGNSGSYDGTVTLTRDSNGHLLLKDSQVTTPVSLYSLTAGTYSAIEQWPTLAAAGTAPVSNGAGGLAMTDICTQAEAALMQPLDSDLTALAGASAAGLWTRTAAGSGAARTITGTSPISVTNGDGVAGNPAVSISMASGSQVGALSAADWTTFNGKQAADADLTNISALTGAGYAYRATDGTWTLAAGSGSGGGDYQPLDSDLTAFAGLSTNGLIARTGAGTVAARTLAGGAGLTVSDGDGVTTSPKVALHVNLTAVARLSSIGLVARTAYGAAAARTLTGGTGVTITNGDGAGGNPSIAIGQSVGTANSPSFVNVTLSGTIKSKKTVNDNTTVQTMGATYTAFDSTYSINHYYAGTATMTGTPTISTTGAVDGQQLTLLNNSAGVLTLQDESVLTGSKLKVKSGTTCVIAAYSGRSFMFNAATGYWVEL